MKNKIDLKIDHLEEIINLSPTIPSCRQDLINLEFKPNMSLREMSDLDWKAQLTGLYPNSGYLEFQDNSYSSFYQTVWTHGYSDYVSTFTYSEPPYTVIPEPSSMLVLSLLLLVALTLRSFVRK